MLGEPMRTPFDLNFSVLGIPVRVHPYFWLTGVIFNIDGKLDEVLLWIGALFVSILIHELGHALLARYCGFSPWIVLHGFGGLAIYRPTYHNWKRQVLISLAGPGAGFLLAGFLAAGLIAAGHHVALIVGGSPLIDVKTDLFETAKSPGGLKLALLAHQLFYINIWWGLINLLPVIPLDGGRVARELLTESSRSPHVGIVRSLQLSLIVAGGVALYAISQHQPYIALMFGFFGFQSYQALQSFSGRGGFGNPW